MGYQEIFNCMKCGFEFVDDYLIFFYDEKSNKTEEFMILMRTCGLDRDAKIKGEIKKTYCPDCDKTIKRYVITTFPQDRGKDFAIDNIKKGLKKDKKYSIVEIENKEDIEYINCPACNKKISSKFNLSNCPKCGEFLSKARMFVD